jgi:hypothetical protein
MLHVVSGNITPLQIYLTTIRKQEDENISRELFVLGYVTEDYAAMHCILSYYIVDS